MAVRRSRDDRRVYRDQRVGRPGRQLARALPAICDRRARAALEKLGQHIEAESNRKRVLRLYEGWRDVAAGISLQRAGVNRIRHVDQLYLATAGLKRIEDLLRCRSRKVASDPA